MTIRKAARVLLVAACCGTALAGCASVDAARISYTAEDASLAEIPGMPRVRFYADTKASVFDSFTGRDKATGQAPINYLALSGGGADGAFGVGLLKGLTATGRRPDFAIVSGVSTGALMAPFVFLGPRYDDTLAQLYGGDFGANLIKDVSVLNGLFGNALVDSDKLGRLVGKYVSQTVIDEVAAEHRKGRRLFVATTNLDSQRAVIWDMGAIAGVGTPASASLFRQVLTASASVPGLFPPRLVEVEANGRSFKEMHVDGGIIQQVFVAPDDVLFGEREPRGLPPLKNLYVLLNNKLEPSFNVVNDNTLAVGTRALATMLNREVHNNVQASFAYARRHGVAYHMAAIPADVDDSASNSFDAGFMRRIYELGEARGRSAMPWTDSPSLIAKPLAGNRKVAASQ